ncbi:hypothetical protein CYMTET_9123 [Cymbomonas tetramitiformis]|uniref:NADH dehydrogenase [ubiquinone] 1 alpha subcomplex subunit 13 n=1 Tax=Cymbomonas tetramitiformis TaxID=36881 RepID=A0AAE0GS48_9CHLO|nr:hypothetical protein CYMTET_9123 [Cymbomonas tetramitiformis]
MTEVSIRGVSGMKSVKDMPISQEMPPPGGFPQVRFARRIPSTGPAGTTLFTLGALVMGYGFYKVGMGNRERRTLKAEKAAARHAILPLLQAEEDRRYVAQQNKFKAQESLIMKDVPGWEVGKSVYYSGAWHPPCYTTEPGINRTA